MNRLLRVTPNPTLREQVVVQMRDAIARGRFRPGERLIERELCEMMNVSRTSIRECLRELESEGLITTVPNRGPIVSVVSRQLAKSVYEVRATLESLACRLFAVRASNEEMAELRRAVAAVERAYTESPGDALPAKDEFYRVLLTGAGNEIATAMLKNIHIRVSQLRATSLSNPDRAAQSIIEIKRLLTCLENRDPVAASAVCVEHIGKAAEAALAVLGEEDPTLAATGIDQPPLNGSNRLSADGRISLG